MDNYNNYYSHDGINIDNYNSNNYDYFNNLYYEPCNHFDNNDRIINYNTNNLVNMNNDSQLLDPYNGFIRGNMFANLYDKYKNYEVIEPKFKNEKEKALGEIQVYRFMLVDLDLYLDIYPNDSNMIKKYNEILNTNNQLIKNYEQKYGPLSLGGYGLNTSPWSWDNNPWPWEAMN